MAAVAHHMRWASRADHAEAGVPLATATLVGAQRRAIELAACARMRRRNGRPDVAIDDIAVCLQLGSDVAREPGIISSMIGIAVAGIAHDEMRAFALDPHVEAAHLRGLRAIMDAFDRQFPRAADAFEAEGLMYVRHLRGIADGRVPGADLTKQAWRHGLSVGRYIEETSLHADMLVDTLRRAEAGPFRLADEAIRAVHTSTVVSRLGGSDLAAMFEGMLPAHRSFRELRARQALLRAAIRVREGAGPADADWPVDPFTGQPIRLRVETRAVVLWSPGPRGRDTGEGDWRVGSELDIVLRVPR